jgi:tRNA(Arg) A34 adenosine deaminase TadA
MVQEFMREAVAAAREGVARRDGGPFGAVIVRDGLVIARACNRVIREQDPTAHAEVNAIREACRALGRFHLEDCDLYTSCEPCPMCLGAIYWSKLRSVCYAATRDDAARVGFSDAQIYSELAQAPQTRVIPFTKVEASESVAVMRLWQADADKSTY